MRDRYTGNSNFEKTVTECVRRGGKESSNSTMDAPGSKMAIKLQLWPNIGFNMYIWYLLWAGLKDQCQKIDSKICMANQGRAVPG